MEPGGKGAKNCLYGLGREFESGRETRKSCLRSYSLTRYVLPCEPALFQQNSVLLPKSRFMH